jgi:hypothetical protein
MVLALLAVLGASGLQIDWQAPGACPQGEELRARVESLVGEAAGRADLTVTGRVAQAGEKWTLVLELVREDSRESRTLSDRACRGLAEAAALVIAVAIDPRASGIGAPVPEDRSVEREPAPGDSTVVPPPPAPVTDTVAPVAEGPAVVPVVEAPTIAPVEAPPIVTAPGVAPKPAARRIAVSVKIGGGVGFVRLLPGVHGVIDGGLAIAGRGWRVEASGLFVPPVRETSGTPGIGGVFRVGAGELRGCGVPALRGGVLGFPLCAGLQLGAMHGKGEGAGLAVQQSARSLWAALRIGPALRWRPRDGRVALWLGVDAVVALTRPLFRTAGMVTVHEVARLGGQATVGVEVRLR